MAAIDDIFISQITHFSQLPDDGGLEETDDFDLGWLKEMTFIETIDISGPRLILIMDDQLKYLTDELNVKPRDVLKVTFSSHWYEGDGDDLDLVLHFRILTMPNEGNRITFNCMEKEVESIKQPWKKSLLFSQKPVTAILGKLLPALKPEAGKFPVMLDYHILPGMRPAKTIRQMCQEMKAACFHRRKSIVFETWDKLKKQEPEITFYHEPPATEQCDEEVFRYEMLRSQEVVKDRVERNYMSWNLKDGIVNTSKATKKPAEWVSQPEATVLDNLLDVSAPTIDLTTSGQGLIRPGVVMKIVWNNTQSTDKPINESLPEKILISTVAHYYSGNQYLCRVKGIATSPATPAAPASPAPSAKVSQVAKAAGEEAKAAEQEAKAAETEVKAAETEAKAAETEVKAAEQEAKAAETTSTMEAGKAAAAEIAAFAATTKAGAMAAVAAANNAAAQAKSVATKATSAVSSAMKMIDKVKNADKIAIAKVTSVVKSAKSAAMAASKAVSKTPIAAIASGNAAKLTTALSITKSAESKVLSLSAAATIKNKITSATGSVTSTQKSAASAVAAAEKAALSAKRAAAALLNW